MATVTARLLDLSYLDILAGLDTPVHRLDPRAKVLTTLAFITAVVSSDRYAVSALLPFAIFPIALTARGNLPAGYLAKKLLLALPFVLFVAIFNPMIDRQILFRAGPFALSGGWLSFFSILLRLGLTVGAALILVATTGFNGVCAAMERLGAPRAFVVQLLFLYRYIFVLAAEGGRMARARELRTFSGRGMDSRTYASLVAHLLLRTVARARRVHLAMLSRGFRGDFTLRRSFGFGWRETLFTAGWSALFLILRAVDLPQLVGTAILEVAR